MSHSSWLRLYIDSTQQIHEESNSHVPTMNQAGSFIYMCMCTCTHTQFPAGSLQQLGFQMFFISKTAYNTRVPKIRTQFWVPWAISFSSTLPWTLYSSWSTDVNPVPGQLHKRQLSMGGPTKTLFQKTLLVFACCSRGLEMFSVIAAFLLILEHGI